MTDDTACNDLMVAIPAYNAEATLGEVVAGVLEIFNSSRIIVIDDGSTDGTAAVAQHFDLILLRHQFNRGKGAALRSAFAYVLAQTATPALISLDADGQHQPAALLSFAQCFASTQADLIIGGRSFDPQLMPVLRILSNRITSRLLSWKIGQSIKDSQSGYRLYSRRLLEALQLETEGYETESEILMQAGKLQMKIGEIGIATVYNGAKSHIRGGREIGRFLKLYLKQ